MIWLVWIRSYSSVQYAVTSGKFRNTWSVSFAFANFLVWIPDLLLLSLRVNEMRVHLNMASMAHAFSAESPNTYTNTRRRDMRTRHRTAAKSCKRKGSTEGGECSKRPQFLRCKLLKCEIESYFKCGRNKSKSINTNQHSDQKQYRKISSSIHK